MISQITEHLELPKDLMLGESIVTLTGQSRLVIENYRGILDYTPECIRIALVHGQIQICGENLQIAYYTNEDMKISGCIRQIVYGR